MPNISSLLLNKICHDCLDCISEEDFKININQQGLVFESNGVKYELKLQNGKPLALKEGSKVVFDGEFPSFFIDNLNDLLSKDIASTYNIVSLQDVDTHIINLNKYKNNYSVNSLFTDMLDELAFEHVKNIMDRVFYNEHFASFLFGEKDLYLNSAFDFGLKLKDLINIQNAEELCKLVFKQVFKSYDPAEGSASLDVILVDFAYHLENELNQYEGTAEELRIKNVLSKIEH